MIQNRFQELMKIVRKYDSYSMTREKFDADWNFSDINLARECETACGAEMFECLEECGANTECSSLCYRASVVCNDACPCHAGI